jgi:hypothetical protein
MDIAQAQYYCSRLYSFRAQGQDKSSKKNVFGIFCMIVYVP